MPQTTAPPRNLGGEQLSIGNFISRRPWFCVRGFLQDERAAYDIIEMGLQGCPSDIAPFPLCQDDGYVRVYTCPKGSDYASLAKRGFKPSSAGIQRYVYPGSPLRRDFFCCSYPGRDYFLVSFYNQADVHNGDLQSTTERYQPIQWNLSPAADKLKEYYSSSLPYRDQIEQIRRDLYEDNSYLQESEYDDGILLFALFECGNERTRENLQYWAQSAYSAKLEKTAIDCLCDASSSVHLLNAVTVLAVLHECRRGPEVESPRALTLQDLDDFLAGNLQIQDVNFRYIVCAFWHQAKMMPGIHLRWEGSRLLGRALQAPLNKRLSLYSECRLTYGSSHIEALVQYGGIDRRYLALPIASHQGQRYSYLPRTRAAPPVLEAPPMTRSLAHEPFMERQTDDGRQGSESWVS